MELKELIKEAVENFKKITINSHEDGEKFFETYGIGYLRDTIEYPYETFKHYESLLEQIKNVNPNKYNKIHKGNPLYFLGWIAFDLKNYEKAVFYMDAAAAEDIKINPNGWLNNPAGKFLTLDPKNHSAYRITNKLKESISTEISRFNNISGQQSISTEDFIEKFVKKIIIQQENHSLITTLYSYILEFEEREKELLLSNEGSIEPILTHLFKGGLIFESLLKYLYPSTKNGTLNDVFKIKNFKSDFIKEVKANANTLGGIILEISDNTLSTAFKTTSKLRNTTGHNLVWDDVFDVPDNFRKLYEQQINAILYIVQKKFL